MVTEAGLRRVQQGIGLSAATLNKNYNAQMVLCIVVSVNASQYTVDVFVPSTGTNFYEVVIGSNIIGSSASIETFPSINQKGILMLSDINPKKVFLSTIPNNSDNYDCKLLEGELKLETKESLIKISKDTSISLKANKSIQIIGEKSNLSLFQKSKSISNGFLCVNELNDNTLKSYSKEIYMNNPETNYFVKKNDTILNGMINPAIEASILNNNSTLLSKFDDLINTVESFHSNIEFWNLETVNDLVSLKGILKTAFSNENLENALIVEKGDSYYNNTNGLLFSLKTLNNGDEKAVIKVTNDGKIIMKYDDLIMERNEVV